MSLRTLRPASRAASDLPHGSLPHAEERCRQRRGRPPRPGTEQFEESWMRCHAQDVPTDWSRTVPDVGRARTARARTTCVTPRSNAAHRPRARARARLMQVPPHNPLHRRLRHVKPHSVERPGLRARRRPRPRRHCLRRLRPRRGLASRPAHRGQPDARGAREHVRRAARHPGPAPALRRDAGDGARRMREAERGRARPQGRACTRDSLSWRPTSVRTSSSSGLTRRPS